MNKLQTVSQAPAQGAAAVTPDDDNDLTNGPCRGLYIGGAGNLDVVMADGTEADFDGLAAGTVVPFAVRRVKESTSATLIVALY